MLHSNIIQVEFFHTPDTPSLAAFIKACSARLGTGDPLKTVVRFYDAEDGHITDLVRKESVLRQKADALLESIPSVTGWRRMIKECERQWLMGTINSYQSSRKFLTIKRILMIARESQCLAIEQPDYSFRFATKHELPKVIESAWSVSKIWMFAFKPNDLLADTNISIASVM